MQKEGEENVTDYAIFEINVIVAERVVTRSSPEKHLRRVQCAYLR